MPARSFLTSLPDSYIGLILMISMISDITPGSDNQRHYINEAKSISRIIKRRIATGGKKPGPLTFPML